jgi:predicted transcriptional regulator
MDAKRIHERIENLKVIRDKAEGRLEELKKTLKREFGITMKEVPTKIKELRRKCQKFKQALEDKVVEFRKEWDENFSDEEGKCPI